MLFDRGIKECREETAEAEGNPFGCQPTRSPTYSIPIRVPPFR
jgi:hypothetical protein